MPCPLAASPLRRVCCVKPISRSPICPLSHTEIRPFILRDLKSAAFCSAQDCFQDLHFKFAVRFQRTENIQNTLSAAITLCCQACFQPSEAYSLSVSPFENLKPPQLRSLHDVKFRMGSGSLFSGNRRIHPQFL